MNTTGQEFHIGGNEKGLSPEEQLDQLSWYIREHYPEPNNPEDLDRWIAHLPDRITHAAMMMLGSAVDHTMPGVVFLGNVTPTDIPELGAVQFTPSNPTGAWAISCHGEGGDLALENFWRPEVAAAAELSGTTILDIGYPDNADQIAAAIHYINAPQITVWAASSAAPFAIAIHSLIDALLLTRPRGALPDSESWPPTCIQVNRGDIAPQGEVLEYLSDHLISTPEVARQRIQDAANFLASR
ncbi:hypothetical protein [Corynebacterium freiburgense]|uniref:hypothetical protein n=1 Tax=Corynebacterium freiburgense TaxID=556548 RepID=UPI000427C71A|nr:hypothetical protein [Corynebacterium freiburgense]WJZ01380.1 hypothetical protein CFREI_00315 [Corynebacterium freiburgense]